MTKDEIEYKAYLFFREKGLEYVDNIDELIEYCRDFAFPLVSYFEEKIAELEQQIEKMKRHCNCKHRDSEGYCEVKRTYLMDLSYDGCDKWELED